MRKIKMIFIHIDEDKKTGQKNYTSRVDFEVEPLGTVEVKNVLCNETISNLEKEALFVLDLKLKAGF